MPHKVEEDAVVSGGTYRRALGNMPDRLDQHIAVSRGKCITKQTSEAPKTEVGLPHSLPDLLPQPDLPLTL